MKNWKVPGLILALLITAMLFRWDTVSSQTISSGYSQGVVKFEKDNWNGAIYQRTYSSRGNYGEKLVNPPFMWIWSKYLTTAWGLATGGTVLWLVLSLRTPKKTLVNKEGE